MAGGVILDYPAHRSLTPGDYISIKHILHRKSLTKQSSSIVAGW
jgi:hypothetical protein